MKICPRCQKTYTDDNLNFCLDDGVVLQQAGQKMYENAGSGNGTADGEDVVEGEYQTD